MEDSNEKDYPNWDIVFRYGEDQIILSIDKKDLNKVVDMLYNMCKDNKINATVNKTKILN